MKERIFSVLVGCFISHEIGSSLPISVISWKRSLFYLMKKFFLNIGVATYKYAK